MSQENVEVVRRAYEALDRKDRAAFVELLDPNVEWWLRPHDPAPGPYRGRHGALEILASDDEFDSFKREVEEYIDGGEYVIAGVRMRGRGLASAAAPTQRKDHRDSRVR